ncbi:hypothetical protein FQN54_008094 [Arachnomyces sp. PD_36]|nr:hypothetical protein FQN54_008094 [Arachnomyces sp. PD_36]
MKRMIKKNARNRKTTFYDKNLRTITLAQCFDATIEDDINIIFMTLDEKLIINDEMMKFVAQTLNTKSEKVTKIKRRQ